MKRLSRQLLRKQRPPKTAATQMRHQAKAQKFKRTVNDRGRLLNFKGPRGAFKR